MNEVHAIKNPEDIKRIEQTLERFYTRREADVWKFGLNTALRISDLLSIQFSDIKNDTLEIIEKKTKKRRTIKLNHAALEVVRRRSKLGDKYLFQSKANNVKGQKPLSRQYITQAFRDVALHLDLKLGTHSMRKSRGYHLHKSGVSVELICRMMNHCHPGITLRYLGLDQEAVDRTYTDFVL